jgi:predicted transcriptional regulator
MEHVLALAAAFPTMVAPPRIVDVGCIRSRICSPGSLTAPRCPHYADFMDLHVPPELEAKLDRLAAVTGRRPDQLALHLLTTSVDHDDWFREEAEKGRQSARAGRLLDHDEVVSRITSDTAADARSLDHRCGRRSRADL